MKDFFKFTFASTLGVVLAGIILSILSIVSIVGIVTFSDIETTVKKNSIFVLTLDGVLNERAEENPIASLLNENLLSCGLDEILASIKEAKDNENIKGIYLEAGMMEAAYASLEEIRN
ncbi:MAG: signal peptide peptidase SppA, partial [Bacteroidaceae bacterium]|nr:signal peptide peptidase SppA [Bacteroidaceae bacterium]